MLEIDHYAYQSRWRDVNPLFKAAAFLGLLLLALCSFPFVQIGILLLVMPATCYGTRIGVKKYLKWLTIPFAFLVFGMVGILVSFAWDNTQMLASFRVGSMYVGLNPISLQIAHNTFWRSLSCLSVTYLFVLSTPFDQLIYIGKKMRLPHILLENILLTYRFIFIFIEEVVSIKRAQTLRFGYISLKSSYQSLGMLVTMLLERVLARYAQMTIALQTKLFKGDFHI